VLDFTALGDPVNAAARMQAAATAGELLIAKSVTARLSVPGTSRTLTVAGRHQRIEAVSLILSR
jgi:adenylate cyclase